MKNQSMEKQLQLYLKQIVDREGPGYLNTNPYEVYLELLQTDGIDACSARLILITLLAGTAEKGMHEKEGLCEYIQEECCLNKIVSDQLAHLYLSLCSEENCKEWNQKINEGFR